MVIELTCAAIESTDCVIQRMLVVSLVRSANPVRPRTAHCYLGHFALFPDCVSSDPRLPWTCDLKAHLEGGRLRIQENALQPRLRSWKEPGFAVAKFRWALYMLPLGEPGSSIIRSDVPTKPPGYRPTRSQALKHAFEHHLGLSPRLQPQCNNCGCWPLIQQMGGIRKSLSNSTLADLSEFPSDWPELEIVPQAAASAPVYDSKNYASVLIGLETTTSRGNVTITSADSQDNPLVSPNLLLTRKDQEPAVQGFKRASQVAMATGITIGPEIAPGPDIQTDGQILEFIRRNVWPYYHAAATCTCQTSGQCGRCPFLMTAGAMGRANDSMAAVDTKGRVFGVKSLRVVDASIFAFLPAGHPQAAVCKS